MRTIETDVYQFDELNDRAKERARDWMREHVGEDFSDWSSDSVIDDAARMAGIIGIDMCTKPVRLIGGDTRMDPTVYWQLHSQGSGASFEGSYSYRKGALKAIMAEAPNDTELHQIAATLQGIQRVHFYKVTASITQHGRDGLDLLVDVYVGDDNDDADDATSEAVRECMRDFAHWIYKGLDREWDFRMSDECIDEDIRANEYEFDADGRRA